MTHRTEAQPPLVQSDCLLMQRSIPGIMCLACCVSCIVGMILMAAIPSYLLMALLGVTLLCCLVGKALTLSGRISIEIATLLPISVLCFLYTPVSWYMFDGLLGCTPYLTILFGTVIVLMFYHRLQATLLISYGLLIAALILYWLIKRAETLDLLQTLTLLVVYAVSSTVIVFIVGSAKRKNQAFTQQIVDLSMRDSLTGLFNRRAVEEVLKHKEMQFTSAGIDYAIVMMDVDHFKGINDHFGHTLGDSILKTLAQCLQQTIRSSDYAFRFGGDEFLLLLANVNDSMVCQIRDRIRESLHSVHGYAFSITISIGYAMRSEGTSSEVALELADQRMYTDKKSVTESLFTNP